MAVTVDAAASAAATTSSGTSLTNNNLTVGSGATALLAYLVFDEVFAVAGSPTASWNSVAMTQLARKQSANVNVELILYGLINPATGNKSLTASWSGSLPAALSAVSFNGSLTTSVATTFIHSATNSGTSGTPSITVTSATGNYVGACGASTGGLTSWTATGSTQLFTYTSPNSENFRGAYAPGASSLAWTAGATSTEWAAVGIDIAAAPTTTFIAVPLNLPLFRRTEMVPY